MKFKPITKNFVFETHQNLHGKFANTGCDYKFTGLSDNFRIPWFKNISNKVEV